MPAMPRIKGKGKDVAFKVLGTPPNMKRASKKNKFQVKVNNRLIFEETQRVR